MRSLFKKLTSDRYKLDLFVYSLVMIAVSLLVLVAHGIALYNYLNGPS
ncbi:MAG: hypothetical protein HYZ01_09540 [Ignavibacteriales bacterium]|nr:hypothetical protein [Ignavibacteriales bacterium]